MNLRELERDSIRAFVQKAADDGYLSGRVLDYGCGKQPYRDIAEAAGGEYFGHDRPDYPGSVVSDFVLDSPENWWDDRWDAILCTQVVQYIPMRDVVDGEEASPLFTDMWTMCDCLSHTSGYLVLTYPTNWPEVETADLHRFTKAGMERLLTDAGFGIVRHEARHGFVRGGDSYCAGYGVVARA